MKLLSKGSSNRAVSGNDDVTVQKDIIFLLSAHSSYFKNNDVIDFIIQKAYEN